MRLYLSSQWWGLYADFPSSQQKQDKREVPEAPLFTSVVHYYAALRRVHTWEIADALGWPQEHTQHILNTLEEPEHIQYCIAVSRYLCIPRRLRDTTLQRAGYHVDATSSLLLDQDKVIDLARQNNALSPQEMAQLDAYFRVEGSFYQVEPMSLNFDTHAAYEEALDVTRLFLQPYHDKHNQDNSGGEAPSSFDSRPGLQAVDMWTKHLEREIKHALWERRDQLLFILYHFYDLALILWKRKASIEDPSLDAPVALHYATNALLTAQRLGNIVFLIKSHLHRADIYHALQRYSQSLQEAREAIRYMAIERKTLRRISPDFLSGDITLLEDLATASEGWLRNQFFLLHARAVSIRKKPEGTYLLGKIHYNDLDADDLKDEGDSSFDTWEEEQEAFEQNYHQTTAPSLRGIPEETDSEVHSFPLAKESERRFLQLVGVYDLASLEKDAFDAVRVVLGKGQRECAISLLIAGLTHPKHLVRAKAVAMLGDLKASEAIERLIKALDDEHGRVRWCAARALGRLQDAQAIPALLRVLTNQESKERLISVLQWDATHQSWPSSHEGRWPDESKVCLCTVEALGDLCDGRAVEPLIAILLDHEWKDQYEALPRTPYWENHDHHQPLLVEYEEKLRCQAAQALGKIGDPRACEALSFVLAEEGQVAHHALRALAQMRQFQVLPILIALFDRIPFGEHFWIDLAIEQMVKEYPDKQTEITTMLIGALSSPSTRIRAGAAHLLGRVGDARSGDALLPFLDAEDSVVRQQALASLVAIRLPDLAERLLPSLAKEDPWARKEIIATLGQIGDTRAVESLLVCLQDPNEEVCTEAIKVLGELGDQRALVPLNTLLLQEERQALHPIISRALCQLHDPEMYQRLAHRLKTTKKAENVRWIVEAFGLLGDPRAIKPLVRLISRQEVKQYPYTQALEALKDIGGKPVVEAICQLIEEITAHKLSISSSLARNALEAREQFLVCCFKQLKALRDPRAVETLLPLLEKRTSFLRGEVQQSLIEALVVFKESRLVKPFVALLQQEVFRKEGEYIVSFNWKLISPVVVALGESGDLAALPVLKQLARFTGEDFFDLPHEARREYTIYGIGEKTIRAIESLTQKTVRKEEMEHWQWMHA